jgi:hypothetical protein
VLLYQIVSNSNKYIFKFISVFPDFEPIRIGVQGELIREGDVPNIINQNRKMALDDSDDEEASSQSSANGRSTMDIYRQRQQKRVKLTTSSSEQGTTPPPVVT